MNEIAIVTPKTAAPTYTNKALNTATQKVYKIGETVRKCAFETAVIIASVESSECYKEDGFNNVHEWTNAAFGFQKSASYTLLKIGREYVREITDSKTGKIKGYMSNLLPEDAEKDFSTTQIEKMLPAGHAFAAELVEREEITPDMTCREIGKIIKSYTSTDEEKESDAEEESKSEVETIDSGDDACCSVTMTIHGDDVVIDNGADEWIIPRDVFDKYKVITA